MASIQNRNGHYLVTICSGYDVYGKKIRNTRTFTPDPSRTKRQQEDDLKRFVRAFEEEIESGVSQDGRKITFKAFSERWLTEYTANLQPGTIAKYDSYRSVSISALIQGIPAIPKSEHFIVICSFSNPASFERNIPSISRTSKITLYVRS